MCSDRSLHPSIMTFHKKCHNPGGRPFKCDVGSKRYLETEQVPRAHNRMHFHHIPDEPNLHERCKEVKHVSNSRQKKKKKNK